MIEIPDAFSEAYEVVRTLQVVSDGVQFRIEVVRVLRGSARAYAAHYYRSVEGAWRELPVPWIAADDEASAAHQAVQFLAVSKDRLLNAGVASNGKHGRSSSKA